MAEERILLLLILMMQQAIGLSDEVLGVVLERELALSQVCRGLSTVTIRTAPPLTVISLSMGCSAFGGSTTLPPLLSGGGGISN